MQRPRGKGRPATAAGSSRGPQWRQLFPPTLPPSPSMNPPTLLRLRICSPRRRRHSHIHSHRFPGGSGPLFSTRPQCLKSGSRPIPFLTPSLGPRPPPPVLTPRAPTPSSSPRTAPRSTSAAARVRFTPRGPLSRPSRGTDSNSPPAAAAARAVARALAAAPSPRLGATATAAPLCPANMPLPLPLMQAHA
jgi:hypothetical protein